RTRQPRAQGTDEIAERRAALSIEAQDAVASIAGNVQRFIRSEGDARVGFVESSVRAGHEDAHERAGVAVEFVYRVLHEARDVQSILGAEQDPRGLVQSTGLALRSVRIVEDESRQ